MNSRRIQLVGLGLAVCLTLLSGWLHGHMRRRWDDGHAMRAAAERLKQVPRQIGDWHYDRDYPLEEVAIDVLDCQGYIYRRYRHQQTSDYVKLIVMVGPGPKMSIHAPEICYGARNFTLLGDRQRHEFARNDTDVDALWSVQFQLNNVSQQRLRVVYGWSDGDRWQAPRSPRWTVASSPILYKMQLSYTDSNHVSAVAETDSNGDLVTRTFLPELLRALRHTLDDEKL